MQRWVGLPYAYQTVGSAMVTRASAYAKIGGMNIRQAGEDFYFLHKFTKRWTLTDVTDTVVEPSPRTSDRVPFGTGKAVSEFFDGDVSRLTSYDPDSFTILKKWVYNIEHRINISDTANPYLSGDKCLDEFLLGQEHKSVIDSFIRSTSSTEGRLKKFYAWFDAFKLFKYLHYARDNGRPDIALKKCIKVLADKMGTKLSSDKRAALDQLRQIDRDSNFSHQWRADLMARLSSTSAS